MERHRLWIIAGACLWLLADSPAAQEAGAAAPAAAAREGVLRLLPAPVTTRHGYGSGQGAFDYSATAGTLALRGGDGEVTAAIFHLAYLREPADPERPVTFVFNGGPGAASAFLNLGAVGPRAVAFAPDGGYLPPPARLVDNPDSWLPFTDLVFVDPVGTGYSRAVGSDEEVRGRFFGVRQDAAAMAAFIRLWLAGAGRTLSPLFLAGESYGGFRAARLAQALPEESGLAPSGVVLISPALEFALLRGEDDYLVVPWATSLPSLAATHLEREGVRPADLAERLAPVERLAMGDYLMALASGQPPAPALAAELARLTGLPPEMVRELRGRIPTARFARDYLKAEGRVLSLYDGSVDGPDTAPGSRQGGGVDPVLDRAVPVWTSALVGHVRQELGYRTDVTYRLLAGDVGGQWDYGTTPSRQGYAGALGALQAGRALNPALEVLLVHGFTDLVTPYFASRYLLDQLPPLSGARPVSFRVLPGGHMFYMRPESRRALAEAARASYARALSGSGD